MPNLGSTDDKVNGTMLGNNAVTLPSYEATLGVTIDTEPRRVARGDGDRPAAR